ncbi:30S ribosomal protein S11 [bacterium]|nr:30S ribosomal protein S11 [bacterium]
MAENKTTKQVRRKKIKKNVPHGRMYVQSTFNNTTITLTDDKGNSLGWATAGTLGYKGSRKSTPYAAGQAVKKVHEVAQLVGMDSVDVFVKGVGSGRETAIRAINSSGLKINTLKDTTPVPHNGPRPKKQRRV